MRVPISWLREYVSLPDDTESVAQRLAMLGFPVASIERRPRISGVVTGRIESVEKHPNADRLLVARVEVGREQPLTIATAATNVAAGQRVAVATIGAQLPQLKIEARTMRGVASQGMMISADELALPAEWFEDGIMQLDTSIAPGLDAIDLFGLTTDVLDVEITANRSDAMSMLGLARELAASYGVALRLPPLRNPGILDEAPDERLSISIESPDCRLFLAQLFDGVEVGPAPAWMRIRLALAGQRPINNLVDVSNYVMLETGEPLHFYDAAKIGARRFVVRSAREGERIATLDGVERVLDSQALVIADEQEALGLAGLMGGAASEVTAKTTAIVLEAANFNGPRIRRMSSALGLRTEASSRHEKSLALALTEFGAARAAALLGDLGATPYRPQVAGERLAAPQAIVLPVAEVERLLGIAIGAERIAEHLTALGCTVVADGNAAFAVTPPAWRRDLTIGADLVEEVARIEGYDRIPAVVPSVPAHDISSASFEKENALAATLAALGYREVVTHSLRASGESGSPEVRNPLSEEHRFLRDSLAPGLTEYLGGFGDTRIFEIGQIFARDGERITETTAIGFGFAAARDDAAPWHDSAFLSLKGDCEALLRAVAGRVPAIVPGEANGFHPGKTGSVMLGEVRLGIIGCIDPRSSKAIGLDENVYLCLLDAGAIPPYATPQYRPPSRFPSTYRDLALVVDTALQASEIERVISDVLGELCTSVAVFDEYRGAQVGSDRKSLAVRITLQRFDTTITDEEADAAVARVLEAVRERLGATIRA